jgi:L-alanine-DL-glutamate epimerase-like enolase superfamily enzyme
VAAVSAGAAPVAQTSATGRMANPAITEWLAVAELALAHRVSLIPHRGDLMRVHQHLGVGHPAVPMIECIPWLQHLFAEPADIRRGVFHVPMTPGASLVRLAF